jgi:hypothetical protein
MGTPLRIFNSTTSPRLSVFAEQLFVLKWPRVSILERAEEVYELN